MKSVDEAKLEHFAHALVNQQAARIIVAPRKPDSGFWFGAGNMIEDDDGNLYLVGRYRNHGDSRAGLHEGERGLELTIFRSADRGQTFQRIVQFSKADLNIGDHEVLSIEGSAIRWCERGVELFVSTEKTRIGYPSGFESYLKPGTGVWTIDRLQADTIANLKVAPIQTVLKPTEPEFAHLKDPFLYRSGDDVFLLFCTHPYCWSSSNTAMAFRRTGGEELDTLDLDFFARGNTWDVAIARGTCALDVPPIGSFADKNVTLMFYDGGESLRKLDEHPSAQPRARGYSCEELGGVAYVVQNNWRQVTRLSRNAPWFVSPFGTGCSRYVDVHVSGDGYFVTWQQSQADFSQPLVMNFVSHDQVRRILT